ncbi:hypothetical protein BHE74_00019533 [Ensete ventricosum]|nr:hypothetical protein BHE74_00019533 [Ensete ventricosum]RZS11097.1 hypothetical protein BHM03_00042400 [Ensete ventricosum]
MVHRSVEAHKSIRNSRYDDKPVQVRLNELLLPFGKTLSLVPNSQPSNTRQSMSFAGVSKSQPMRTASQRNGESRKRSHPHVRKSPQPQTPQILNAQEY